MTHKGQSMAEVLKALESVAAALARPDLPPDLRVSLAATIRPLVSRLVDVVANKRA